MIDKIFSWLPFFEELLDIICKRYNSYTLYEEFKKLVPENQYNDINQMDPLTFIGCICGGNKIAINRALLVKERFNMQSNQISDITGIPNFVHGAYKYFHEIYKGADIDYIMKLLWDFARQINVNKINAETFNEIINFKEVRVGKLSQIMYICKPRVFFSCDTIMLSYLDKNIENDYDSFLQIQNFCKTLNTTPYDLSYKAWEYFCQRKKFFKYIEKIDRNSYINFINQHIINGELERKIFQLSNTKLYDIKNRNELDILLKKLKNNAEWVKYDKANGNGIPNAILNTHYRNFINSLTLNMLDINQWNQETLTEISQSKSNNFQVNIPLNQILYGPPGTGKTYNTVLKAMSIVDGIEYKDVSEDKYYELKKRFDQFKQAGQIEFVTFHQSYSYEEFVEGIRPEISDWEEASETLNYIGKDGIFKRICNRAEKDLFAITKDAEIDFDKAYKLFQEKYEIGSDLLNLKNIRYEKNNLVYHFGNQPGDRRIDLSKIKEIFNSNKKYETATEFNKDYKGNNPLKGYFFNFYKELIKIKNDCDKENQDKNNINQNSRRYVLIIDEINRGNISKIFGELITLIETDKRLGGAYELQVSLPYSKETFGVPKNLYIIGTMNTSDRSIASIDIALRRRFKFVEMMPDSSLVADFGCNFKTIFENINNKIKILLDRDHQIGHSYFINTKYSDANGNNNTETLKEIWYSEILPLLNEYFYCDWDKLKLIIPGFIKEEKDIPESLKNECENSIYEFKTPEEVEDFESAIKQEKYD